MGVDRQDYIMFGWKLPYEITDANGDEIDPYDKYEDFEDSPYDLICDGMCGRYNVFGKVINDGGDQYEGWDFVDLDVGDLDSTDLKLQLRELIGPNQYGEPKLFIFSHFS